MLDSEDQSTGLSLGIRIAPLWRNVKSLSLYDAQIRTTKIVSSIEDYLKRKLK